MLFYCFVEEWFMRKRKVNPGPTHRGSREKPRKKAGAKPHPGRKKRAKIGRVIGEIVADIVQAIGEKQRANRLNKKSQPKPDTPQLPI